MITKISIYKWGVGLVAVLLVAVPAYALDLGHDTERRKEITHDRNKTFKRDTSAEKGMEVRLKAAKLFYPIIEGWEREGVAPFAECRILSKPPLISAFVDIGDRGDYIDTTAAEVTKSKAAAGAPIKGSGDENGLLKVRDCLTIYGAVLGQGIINLATEINARRGGEVPVGVGRSDLEVLARISLDRTRHEGITDPSIKKAVERAAEDDRPCRFVGTPERITCGNVIMFLDARPTASVGGVAWFGEGEYAGMETSYFLKNANRSEMESTKKKAISYHSTASSKVAMGLNSLMPSIHQ